VVWIVVLGVLAVALTAALIWDRRRGRRESYGSSPDQWKAQGRFYSEHQGPGENP
jgi:hypothetical protein